MKLTEEFIRFLHEAATELGQFCLNYAAPLDAFLSFAEDHESYEIIEEIGLSAGYIYTNLDKVLSQDAFLFQCCGNKEHLVQALDILLFSRISDCFKPYSLSSSVKYPYPTLFDERIKDLDSQIYGQGVFEKVACFHLFNFNVFSKEDLPPPPYSDWNIVKLEPGHKAKLLGENSFSSFLSPLGTGEIFLTVKDNEGFNSESLNDWLYRRWVDAAPYRQILQYAKDGIVDIDYVVPYFNPPWVNIVQRGGVYYQGTPRQDKLPQALGYWLLPEDVEYIQALWGLYQKHADELQSTNSTLRKATSIAGEFFEDSHKKVSRIEQFSNLIIALEALYTPSDQSELTFRISQSCALLVGDSGSTDRHSIFNFLKKMFKKRGKLFHGQYERYGPSSEVFIDEAELLQLISIVRISILKFISLFIRGERDLKKVREDIEKAILVESLREEFLAKADFETLLKSEES